MLSEVPDEETSNVKLIGIELNEDVEIETTAGDTPTMLMPHEVPIDDAEAPRQLAENILLISDSENLLEAGHEADDERPVQNTPNQTTDSLSQIDLNAGASAESVSSSQSKAPLSSFSAFAWGKASGAASSLFAAASQVTKEPRLRDFGVKLTELINVAEDAEGTRSPPGMVGDYGIMAEPATPAIHVEPRATLELPSVPPSAPALQPTESLDPSPEGEKLDQRLQHQMEVINRLHTQMMQTEEALSQAREKELELTETVQRLTKLSRARELEVKALEKEMESATARVAREVTRELQLELETTSKENEKRLSDLRRALREAQNQLESYQSMAAEKASVDELMKHEGENFKKMLADLTAERDELQATLEEVEVRYSTDLEKWQSDLATAVKERKDVHHLLSLVENAKAAAEVELQKVSAQNSTLKARVSAMETFARSLGGSPDPSEIWRQAQTEILGLRNQLRDAEGRLQSARNEAQALQQQSYEAQAMISNLREALAAASSSTTHNGFGTEQSTAPTLPTDDQMSTIAVLEARLAAKSERVETLVCEIAALRAAQTNQRTGSLGPVLYSDGRSWIYAQFEGLLLKTMGPGVTDSITRVIRKVGDRTLRSVTYKAIDLRVRDGLESLLRARVGRGFVLIYLILLHIWVVKLMLSGIASKAVLETRT